jgi:hypothetical protein
VSSSEGRNYRHPEGVGVVTRGAQARKIVLIFVANTKRSVTGRNPANPLLILFNPHMSASALNDGVFHIIN